MCIKYDYFDTFVFMVENSCSAFELLKNSLVEYNTNKVKRNLDEIDKLVRQSEKEKQILIEKLDKEFIAPIEKVDIIEIAQRIIKLTYSIEDGLNMICSCDLASVRCDLLLLVQINESCCLKLKDVIKEFRNFKKSKMFNKNLALFNRVLDKGRKNYNQVIYRCNITNKSLNHIQEFKKILDSIIELAFIIERAIINNS